MYMFHHWSILMVTTQTFHCPHFNPSMPCSHNYSHKWTTTRCRQLCDAMLYTINMKNHHFLLDSILYKFTLQSVSKYFSLIIQMLAAKITTSKSNRNLQRSQIALILKFPLSQTFIIKENILHVTKLISLLNRH